MKRLRLVASSSERERLMKALAFCGVVELSETDAGDIPVSEVNTDSEKLQKSLSELLSAEATAKKYGSFKKGMFTPRPEMKEKDIFSSELVLKALCDADRINDAEEEISRLNDRKLKLKSELLKLEPWENLELPLEVPSGKKYISSLITSPATVAMDTLREAMAGASELSELFEISSDSELRYMLLGAYRDEFDKVFSALKILGAASISFRGSAETAKASRQRILREMAEIDEAILIAKKKIEVTLS